MSGASEPALKSVGSNGLHIYNRNLHHPPYSCIHESKVRNHAQPSAKSCNKSRTRASLPLVSTPLHPSDFWLRFEGYREYATLTQGCDRDHVLNFLWRLRP